MNNRQIIEAYTTGKQIFNSTEERVAHLINSMEEARENFNKKYKTVIEQLPVADLNGAKTFAEVYGYKFEVKYDNGAVYYKNANDIGKFDGSLQTTWAVAVPTVDGFKLIVKHIIPR